MPSSVQVASQRVSLADGAKLWSELPEVLVLTDKDYQKCVTFFSTWYAAMLQLTVAMRIKLQNENDGII